MERLTIENENEIRCPYCLEWNMRSHDQCYSCLTPTIEIENFGAARTLLLEKKIDRYHIKQYLKDVDKSHLENWNETYRKQVQQLKAITGEIELIGPELVLISSEELDKYFLEELPIKAEKFQEYRDYIPPETKAGDFRRLKYIFRSHPIKLYRALSTIALIHKGSGDEQILGYLTNWEPKSKTLHQERILSYSHWSLEQYTATRNFTETKSILPLLKSDRIVAGWASLYLYNANYNRQETSIKLAELSHTAPLHLAISCAVTLRDYEKVKEILSFNINESTLPIAIHYSDETFIPGFINFLNIAPSHLHELIIRRIGGLRPHSLSYKIATLNWLLNQENEECFEAIFYWGEIPLMEQVVGHLLKSHRGLAVLANNLCFWLENLPETSKLPFWILDDKLLKLNRDLLPQEENMLERLQKSFFEKIYYLHCNRIKFAIDDFGIKKLCNWLFISPALDLETEQVYTGFNTLGQLIKSFDNKSYLIFRLNEENLLEKFGSGQNFLTILERYVLKAELNDVVCEFIQAMFYLHSENPKGDKEAEIFLDNLIQVMLDCILKGKLKNGARIQFLKYLEGQLEFFEVSVKTSSKILDYLTVCKDLDSRHRLKRIIAKSKPG